MNISGLGSTTAVSAVLPRNDNDADDVQQAAGALPGATQTTISPEGGIFGQLAQLAQSNPDQFKQVATEISQKLKDEAAGATGDKATFLNNLADKFGQAAQTGDLSSLKPGGAHGHHHGHHHRGGSGPAAGSAGQGGQETLAQILQQSLQDVTGGSSTPSSTTQAAPASQVSSTPA